MAQYDAAGLASAQAAAEEPRELGRRGGSATSDTKAAAVRENGKKGGRPHKAG
jgi:general stress protein YciG